MSARESIGQEWTHGNRWESDGRTIFGELVPISADYATRPIEEGFNWQECLAGVEAGEWYLVVFRSIRRETADEALLAAYDDRAHADARTSSDFLVYFKGHRNGRRECLSFCLWQSRAAARTAARRRAHVAATRMTPRMYESYVLERYVVTKRSGADGGRLTFERMM